MREALARPAAREAPARARAAAEAAPPRAPGRSAPGKEVRTQKQLAYERRRRQERTRKQQRAAKLLAQGMTQQAVAAELGVTTHTLRNWKSAPAFQRELERQRARAARKPASAPASERKPRPKREPARRRARARKPDPATGQQPEPAAAAANQPAIELDDGVPIFPDTAEGLHRARRLLRGTQAQQPALFRVRLHRRETWRAATTGAPRARTTRQSPPTIRTAA